MLRCQLSTVMKMGPNVICAESNEELDASVNERKMNMGGLSFLRVMIREPEIPLFIMALLLTGFAHNSPSNMQRIQVFHAQDTRLWV